MPLYATAGPPGSAGGKASPPPWAGVARYRRDGEPDRRAPPGPPAQPPRRRHLEACRPAPRGGHAERCPTWGGERDAENACRQGRATAAGSAGAPCHGHGVIAAGARASPGARGRAADARVLWPVRAWRTVLRGTVWEARAPAGASGAVAGAEGPTALGSSGSVAPRRTQRSATAGGGRRHTPLCRPCARLRRCRPRDPSRGKRAPPAPRRA